MEGNKAEVKKVGEMNSEIRKAMFGVSKPIDSKVYADKLNELVNKFFDEGKLTINHIMAIVRFFKVFNMKSSDAATETLEAGMNKANKDDLDRFKKAKPYLQKLDALRLVKEVIRLFEPYDDKVKTAANWARLPILVTVSKEIFASALKYVVPDGRALIMTRFMWNTLNFEEAYQLMSMRLNIVAGVFKFATKELGGFVKRGPKTRIGDVVIESPYFEFTKLKEKYIAAKKQDPVPGAIASEEINKTLIKDGKVVVTIDNFASAKSGAMLPSITHLLMTADYRIAKSPSGTTVKGSAELIDDVKKRTAGLMVTVIKLVEKSWVKPEDNDLDPKKEGALRLKYWECYKTLTTTLRQMDYALYGKSGGANTRTNMMVRGQVPVLELDFSFE